MATVKVTDYVVRFNATANRKELRRRGYSSYVSGGGIIIPGGGGGGPTDVVANLVTNQATPVVGSSVTLTASATGGTTPYVATFFPPAGVTLTGTGMTRTFTAPSTLTALTFRVSIADAGGLIDEATVVVTPRGAVSATALFAGHIPNRVVVGMATADGGAGPNWPESRTIVGQPVYEFREFTSGWITQSAFDSMVNKADQGNCLPWISFKEPGGSDVGWQGIRNGQYNSDLASLATMVKDYGKPVLVSIHHEPAGDGDLTFWAQMNEYCAWYFAGYRSVSFNSSTNTIVKGAYNAANDLSLNNGGNMTWAPCGNGFWWRPATPQADANLAYPPSLIAALNACKGIVGNDFYDADYIDQAGAASDPSLRVAGSGVRTSVRIQHFMTWARQKGVQAAGCGEFGVIDGSEMAACWKVMRENRDIWAVSNYFNSMTNSDHDWRLVPANYPDTNYQSSKTPPFQDFGGNTQSAGRLAAYKTMLTESISAQYTSPL